jgi:hypothetical protein
MAATYSENLTHRTNLITAEMVRQISVAAAGTNQAAIKTAELTFARTCLTSAQANSCSPSQWTTMLKELGVQT